MPSKVAGALVVGAAAAALCVVGYRQTTTTPARHEATPASCTPQSIKDIGDITERAIQSAKCAQPLK